jgi:hypothetical protein
MDEENRRRKFLRPIKLKLRGIAETLLAGGDTNVLTRLLEQRLESNLSDTGHPFHHKTEDGTFVEPDPAIEWLLTCIPADDRVLVMQRWENRSWPDAPEAKPVDRLHSGTDFYDSDPKAYALLAEYAEDNETINQHVESGIYEYRLRIDANETHPLQISLRESMRTFVFTPEEALDLLDLLQNYQTELEELVEDQEEDELNQEEEQEDED